jgi:hypothetical protein
MGDQVTSETLRENWDGAWHHMLVVEAGKLGITDSHHGDCDRWDWGVTLASLVDAQDRERQADRLVRQMTPLEREGIWLGDGPEQELLRRAARRMA